jgi:hypothetical protein
MLLGAPTIHARLKVAGEPAAAQVAGRLWDVAPGGGSQTLVARGVYRPTGAAGGEVWQLHANGWRFKAGHVPKLELLGSDPPSSRPSNGTFQVAVERLELRLPVREVPDCRVVLPAAAPVLPPGQQLAPGVRGSAAPGCGRSPFPQMLLSLRCTEKGTLATATVGDARVRRVDFYARGRLVGRDRRAPFRRIVLRPGRTRFPVRIGARAVLTGAPILQTHLLTRGCRARRRASSDD